MSTKMFTVEHFLGLNEADESTTELKLGEACRMQNFTVTDGYNLKTRPGIVHWSHPHPSAGIRKWYERVWCGYIGQRKYAIGVIDDSAGSYLEDISNRSRFGSVKGSITHFLQVGDKHCALWRDYDGAIHILAIDASEDGNLTTQEMEPYTPLTITAAAPAGGGAALEQLNILTDRFRVQFNAAGKATAYVLPDMVETVLSVDISGVKHPPADVGSFNANSHTFTMKTAPKDGDAVTFVCSGASDELAQARDRFCAMERFEYFNGSTDSRIFFYGDGTNVCYYTAAPAFAASDGYGAAADVDDGTQAPAGIYLPAGNEITVDFSNTPITALIRDYNRLLVYKLDGVGAITYDTMTLADGKVTAGFCLHTVSREFGNEAMGQVVAVGNYPRSVSRGSIYEWRVSSASYRDERYAKCVSQKVARTLAAADLTKAIACDDEKNKTYYLFLNDEQGTVLVNRYALDVWTVYNCALAVNITQGFVFEDKVMFVSEGEVFAFDPGASLDDDRDPAGEKVAIQAVWESGYMAFGADYLRKYSSTIWVSMQPEGSSKMEVTVSTDKKERYMVKSAGTPQLDFGRIDFSNFSFLRAWAPTVKRIKLKVKKFIYYKLIFEVSEPGARATVLGVTQQVRFGSTVK